MNIVSTIFGMTVAASALPMMTTMSLAPIEAAKRSSNFSAAEAGAVTMLAQAQTEGAVTTVPAGCGIESLANGVYQFICTEGAGAYQQTVTRTWVGDALQTCDDNDGDNGHGNSGGYDCSNPSLNDTSTLTFAYVTPSKISYVHQCPPGDEWGVNWWNATYPSLGACTPQIAWTKQRFKKSDPSEWLYDISNFNGWGMPN